MSIATLTDGFLPSATALTRGKRRASTPLAFSPSESNFDVAAAKALALQAKTPATGGDSKAVVWTTDKKIVAQRSPDDHISGWRTAQGRMAYGIVVG